MEAQRRVGAISAGVGAVAPMAGTETSLTVSTEHAVAAAKAEAAAKHAGQVTTHRQLNQYLDVETH